MTPAAHWYARLPAPAQSVGWRDQMQVRRYTSTPRAVTQPALAETVLCLHLGGAKQVRRTCEGHATDHLVECGSLTLMPAGVPNRWLTHGPIDYAHLVLSQDLLRGIAAEDFASDPDQLELRGAVGLCNPWLEQLFRQILLAVSAGPRAASLHIESLLVVVAATLLRDHAASREPRGEVGPVKGGLAPWRLRQVDDYIQSRLGEEIALEDLTALTGLSRAQFYRAFKQSTGRSPARRLLDLRLERARALLDDRRLSDEDIGLQVGLGENFATAFRQRYGVSTRLYRLANA